MKTCTSCKRTRPYAAFPPNLSRGGYKPRCYQCVADQRRLDRHGLIREDKAAIADAQDGCAICGRTDPGGKGWCVDHDRACCSGQTSCEDCRRGVLCQWCNAALGYAHDDPDVLRRMADYLELGTRLNPSVPRYTDSVDRTAVASPTRRTDERTNERSASVSSKSAVAQRAREQWNS